MEKYAIIKLGGKQFMVKEGDRFSVERQAGVKLDVLLFSDGKNVLVGSPNVEGVEVKAEILKNVGERARKIRVGRFRNKSRYRKIKGHTQPMSMIKINSISHGVKEKEVVKIKKAVTKKAPVKSSKKKVKK